VSFGGESNWHRASCPRQANKFEFGNLLENTIMDNFQRNWEREWAENGQPPSITQAPWWIAKQTFHCLLNTYHHERDQGIDWHVDNGVTYRPQDPIMSITLESPGVLLVRPLKSGAKTKTSEFVCLLVWQEPHDCVIMGGRFQTQWEHAVPPQNLWWDMMQSGFAKDENGRQFRIINGRNQIAPQACPMWVAFEQYCQANLAPGRPYVPGLVRKNITIRWHRGHEGKGECTHRRRVRVNPLQPVPQIGVPLNMTGVRVLNVQGVRTLEAAATFPVPNLVATITTPTVRLTPAAGSGQQQGLGYYGTGTGHGAGVPLPIHRPTQQATPWLTMPVPLPVREVAFIPPEVRQAHEPEKKPAHATKVLQPFMRQRPSPASDSASGPATDEKVHESKTTMESGELPGNDSRPSDDLLKNNDSRGTDDLPQTSKNRRWQRAPESEAQQGQGMSKESNQTICVFADIIVQNARPESLAIRLWCSRWFLLEGPHHLEETRALEILEKQVTNAENMIRHSQQIVGRPWSDLPSNRDSSPKCNDDWLASLEMSRALIRSKKSLLDAYIELKGPCIELRDQNFLENRIEKRRRMVMTVDEFRTLINARKLNEDALQEYGWLVLHFDIAHTRRKIVQDTRATADWSDLLAIEAIDLMLTDQHHIPVPNDEEVPVEHGLRRIQIVPQAIRSALARHHDKVPLETMIGALNRTLHAILEVIESLAGSFDRECVRDAVKLSLWVSDYKTKLRDRPAKKQKITSPTESSQGVNN